MTATMRDSAREIGAPLLVCLEGGYDPVALAASVVATLEAVTGDRAPRQASPQPAAAAAARLGGHWPTPAAAAPG